MVGVDFVEAMGTEGTPYLVRVMKWSLDNLQSTWEKWKGHQILGDDIPNDFQGFAIFVTLNNSIWFEVIDLLTDEQVGLVYLNEMVPSLTSNRISEAHFHTVQWDSKAGPRLPVARAFIARVFRVLGLHRMVVELPLKFGGAIRQTKKLGFVQEGIRRSARPYDGQWYDVAVFSLLEEEVQQWAAHSSPREPSLTEPQPRITLVNS